MQSRHSRHSRPSQQKRVPAHSPAVASFSLERMLGTAIVLAAMDVKMIMSREQHAIILAKAEGVPWEMPPHRDFRFFYGLCKQLIAGVEGSSSWLKLMQITRLMLLQEPDGSFVISPTMCVACRCGLQTGESIVSYLCKGDLKLLEEKTQLLLEVMPRELSDLCLLTENTEREIDPQRIWATLLATSLAKTHDLQAVYNPAACENPGSAEVRSITSEAEKYLKERSERNPKLALLRDGLQERAMTLVAEWSKVFEEMKGEYKEESEKKKQSKDAVKELTKSQAPAPRLHVRCLNGASALKKWFLKRIWVGLSAHAIVSIFMTKHSDPFSMGDKMFVQTNTFVTMLSFAIGLYFSKAYNCCEEGKAFLGCSIDGRFSECMGYATCVELSAGRVDLPEELENGSFVCLAFPQAAIMHRLVIVLIMVVCLVPVQSLLAALFQSPIPIPKHFSLATVTHESMVKKANKRGLSGCLQGCAFALYGLFFNITKLNKAVATLLVALINALCLPAAHFKTAVKTISKVVAGTPRKCINTIMGPEWVAKTAAERECLAFTAFVPFRYLDNGYVKYMVLGSLWVMATWILLTYGMLIRAMQGPDAEKQLISAWGLCLVIELFGKEGIKLLVLRNVVTEVQGFFQRLFTNEKTSMQQWLDHDVSRYVQARSANANDADDSEDDMEDLDDFDEVEQNDVDMDMDVDM